MHLSLLSLFFLIYCTTYNFIQDQGKDLYLISLTINNHNDKKLCLNYNYINYN